MDKIAIVIGTRPNFMKAIPIWSSLKNKCQCFFIHTGQHYSYDLSQIFLDEFKINEKYHQRCKLLKLPEDLQTLIYKYLQI